MQGGRTGTPGSTCLRVSVSIHGDMRGSSALQAGCAKCGRMCAPTDEVETLPCALRQTELHLCDLQSSVMQSMGGHTEERTKGPATMGPVHAAFCMRTLLFLLWPPPATPTHACMHRWLLLKKGCNLAVWLPHQLLKPDGVRIADLQLVFNRARLILCSQRE